MLIFFHYLGMFIFHFLRKRKKLKTSKDLGQNFNHNEEELANNLKFDPPVYKQRYARVYETLINEKWRVSIKKLVDFGCAEFGLFVFLKNLNIEEILFVDIDECLLREKIGYIEPLLIDLLRRRCHPLEVSVYAGSVADPDYRLCKTDVVTAIELIEHLYPDTLEAFPYNVFYYIEPYIVIITTPNIDFNVMFNRSQGFRHDDHKFEWTREQFQDWAINITERFPNYTVEISGIGKGPENSKPYGCCSQMALFIRKDLLDKMYISPLYAQQCKCDNSSPCKGQTSDCKLLCKCVCPFCLPNFSYGICTYSSCSKLNSDSNIIVQNDTKKFNSDTDINCKVRSKCKKYSPELPSVCDLNPMYNIYYKLIEKIDYPYEVDNRSEEERLLQTLIYRINVFSNINSRFYVEKRSRCEIPLKDLLYGDLDVSVEEIGHLLSKNDYKIEKCIIQETGLHEDCILSTPQEMEDITTSSELTEEYSAASEHSEKGNFKANTECLSDWDDMTYAPKDSKNNQEEASCSTIVPLEAKKPNLDPLFDSGYLKSPSPLDPAAKVPQLSLQDNLEAEKTDKFDENWTSTKGMSSDNNKLHLRKTVAKEKFAGPSVPERVKCDPNRVNELDRFSTKTFTNNHSLKQQNEAKKALLKAELLAPGPSNEWKKVTLFQNVKKEKTEKKDVEPTPLDDAKSITNCIILNSLNKIDVKNEYIISESKSLPERNAELEQNLEAVLEAEQGENFEEALVGPVPIPEIFDAVPQEIIQVNENVENGDLANNNRDNEGNNFIANNEDQDIDEGIDLLNDNLEEIVPLLEDNVHAFDNNNEFGLQHQNDDLALEGLPQENVVEIGEVGEAENEAENLRLEDIAQASCEALYDVNSEQDLLDDFDIPPQANQDDIFEQLNPPGNVILLSINGVSFDSAESSRREQSPNRVSNAANTSNSFPNWLLQILGTHVVPEEAAPARGSHDEPHFYCQGDGLGVHPSIIAVEIDEAEDADNDTTTTEESSSNNTADYAEVEPGPSDMFDMSSLPEEFSVGNSLVEDHLQSAQVEENEADVAENVEILPIVNSTKQLSSQKTMDSYHLVNDIDKSSSISISNSKTTNIAPPLDVLQHDVTSNVINTPDLVPTLQSTSGNNLKLAENTSEEEQNNIVLGTSENQVDLPTASRSTSPDDTARSNTNLTDTDLSEYFGSPRDDSNISNSVSGSEYFDCFLDSPK